MALRQVPLLGKAAPVPIKPNQIKNQKPCKLLHAARHWAASSFLENLCRRLSLKHAERRPLLIRGSGQTIGNGVSKHRDQIRIAKGQIDCNQPRKKKMACPNTNTNAACHHIWPRSSLSQAQHSPSRRISARLRGPSWLRFASPENGISVSLWAHCATFSSIFI